jgi:hypothetical protein
MCETVPLRGKNALGCSNLACLLASLLLPPQLQQPLLVLLPPPLLSLSLPPPPPHLLPSLLPLPPLQQQASEHCTTRQHCHGQMSSSACTQGSYLL